MRAKNGEKLRLDWTNTCIYCKLHTLIFTYIHKYIHTYNLLTYIHRRRQRLSWKHQLSSMPCAVSFLIACITLHSWHISVCMCVRSRRCHLVHALRCEFLNRLHYLTFLTCLCMHVCTYTNIVFDRCLALWVSSLCITSHSWHIYVCRCVNVVQIFSLFFSLHAYYMSWAHLLLKLLLLL
jgi:hypothetical protein